MAAAPAHASIRLSALVAALFAILAGPPDRAGQSLVDARASRRSRAPRKPTPHPACASSSHWELRTSFCSRPHGCNSSICSSPTSSGSPWSSSPPRPSGRWQFRRRCALRVDLSLQAHLPYRMTCAHRSVVYFSTSANHSRNRTTGQTTPTQPKEWTNKIHACAYARCPGTRRNVARLHPVDPPRAGRRRHPAAVLRHGHLHRLLPEEPHQHQRRVLHGGARNDGLDRRPELLSRQPRLARADGLGRRGLPVRHPGRALVLDRRHPRHALPGHRDDALLLHLQDALGARLSATALRRRRARAVGASASP